MSDGNRETGNMTKKILKTGTKRILRKNTKRTRKRITKRILKTDTKKIRRNTKKIRKTDPENGRTDGAEAHARMSGREPPAERENGMRRPRTGEAAGLLPRAGGAVRHPPPGEQESFAAARERGDAEDAEGRKADS